jgi:hypothetical protein
MQDDEIEDLKAMLILAADRLTNKIVEVAKSKMLLSDALDDILEVQRAYIKIYDECVDAIGARETIIHMADFIQRPPTEHEKEFWVIYNALKFEAKDRNNRVSKPNKSLN